MGGKMTPNDITPIVNNTFGPNVCKTTTRNAPKAVADTLKPQAGEIRESLSDYNLLKADETTYQMKTTDAESKQGTYGRR